MRIFFLISELLVLLILESGCMMNIKVTDLSVNDKNSLIDSPVVANPSDITEPVATPLTQLKLTGQSSGTSDVGGRIFNENSGPWILTGTCNSVKGTVLISGDIDSSFSINCINDSFSVALNYASISPFFNSAQGTARKIAITQGTEFDEVNLYKTASGQTVKLIRAMSDFIELSNFPDGVFIVANDIDASDAGTIPTNNFAPGNIIFSEFVGELQGDNRTLSNFNRTSGVWDSCLVVWVGRGAIFKNIRMTNIQLSTGIYVAQSSIAPLFCRGNSSIGTGNVLLDNIYIQGEFASIDVDTVVGGLGAVADIPLIASNIKVDINIFGSAAIVGGLFGITSQAIISKGHVMAAFNITTKPNNPVGGIVGSSGNSSKVTQISNSYFSGTINQGEIIGGLIGKIMSNGQSIENSYALVNISVPNGKVGGPVFGSVGSYAYNLSNVYYSSERTCTLCTNFLGLGKTDLQMKSQSTYLSWDFTNIWDIKEGVSSPTHR